MSQQKSLQNASMNWHILNWIAIIGMIVTSLYLTDHYFTEKFPSAKNLSSGTLCNINAFFTCSKATHSPLSNIAGVPISLFGLLMGLIFGFAYFLKNDESEGTNHLLSYLNFAGCLILFAYSLIALGTLCPLCTLYYVFSGIVAFVFFKNSQVKTLDLKYAGIYLLIFIITGAIAWNYVSGKNKKTDVYAESLIKQFYSLPDLGNPPTDSPFLVSKASEKFADAPVRITKFSDFECPACGMLSETLVKIAIKYPGKVSIQYKFYPLDANCNASIKRQIHPFACQASYLTYCAPDKFETLHHEIFNQVKGSGLSTSWLNNKAESLGVTDCFKSPATKEAVVKIISEAKAFNIQSTPTLLLNGIKIEGVRPIKDYYIIIDEILRRSSAQ